MPERTLADIDEEIAAIRAAYLEAVKMNSASTSSGGSSRSIQRQNIDSLRKQLNALNVERSRKSRGGIKIFGGTPA